MTWLDKVDAIAKVKFSSEILGLAEIIFWVFSIMSDCGLRIGGEGVFLDLSGNT